MKKSFRIYDGDEKRLEKAMKKLARHSEKMGYGKVEIFSIGKAVEAQRTVYSSFEGEISTRSYAVMVKDVEVDIPEQFLNYASAEWLVIGQIVAAVTEDGKEVVEIMAEAGPMVEIGKVAEGYNWKCGSCTHSLKKAFAIKHRVNGEILLVGKECLKKYTGADAEAIIALVEFVACLEVKESDGEERCGGGRGSRNYQVIDLENYLAVALAVIERDGSYFKRWELERGCFGEPRENPYCTRNHALAQFIGIRKSKTDNLGAVIPGKFIFELDGRNGCSLHDVVVPSEANKARAEELVKEWIASVSLPKRDGSKDEYAEQCKMIAERGWITEKTAGVAASMYNGPRKPEKDYSGSQYQGTVEERMIFKNLTVDMAFEREGDYGMSTIYKFVDAKDNVYTWFASGCGQFRKGEVIPALKATVKAHEEYKGVKQTILSRASVYDVAEEAAKKEAKKVAAKAKKAAKKAEATEAPAEPMQLVVGF